MTKYFKSWLSSISVKLFFWFWIVAIISVLSSHFIISQLTEDSLILPAHRGDMRQLQKISRYNNHHANLSIKEFLQSLPLYKANNVWLKDNNKHIYSAKKRANKILKNYLLQNSLTDPISIQFRRLRLTGPLSIKIKNQPYQLYISNKLNHRVPPLSVHRIPLWLRITITVTISFFLLWLLAKSLSKPLLKIQQAANNLGNGKLNTRVTELDQRHDELGQLAKSFNQMAEKLENSMNAQQRLLGDVSHELRSPMTRLQLAIALAHKSKNSPDELEKYLLRCESEINRLDGMLENVIALSRLENTMPSINKMPVNIHKLLDDLVTDAQFLANEKNIIIHNPPSQDIMIHADEQLLASAIGNILTNAVKYSSKKSHITVQLSTNEQQLVIKITDSGVGVPETALEQLFEPFYRVQNDRARATGGSGLGLAIAKQAIIAHHGTIEAYNNDTHGLTVEIKLPCN
jgi:two-component system sensor histidine kinase CpxA